MRTHIPWQSLSLLICTLLFLAVPLAAQNLAPASEDVQVNAYTTGIQFFATVDVEDDGEFVVIWTTSDSTYGPDTSGYKVDGQLFASDRTATGFGFQVNSYTNDDQVAPQVQSQGDDAFLVVWQSSGSSGADTSATSILAQRMTRSGGTVSANGGEFEINDFTTSIQTSPSLAVRSDQGFVVSWESYSSPGDDTSGSSIQARRFNATGTPQGGQFQVNTYTYSYQRFSKAAIAPDDSFVVVWESFSSDSAEPETTSIRARRFASNGTPLGGEFQVNTYTLGVAVGEYWYPSVAVNANGDFLVVWGSIGSAGGDNLPEDYSIQGRFYDSDGTPMGNQFQINTYSTGNQRAPEVSATRAVGDFLVTWNSAGSPGDDIASGSIQGRQFDPTGSPFAPQFQINTYTTGEQIGAVHGVRNNGELVVVWESYGSTGNDTDLSALLFRPFLADGDNDFVADVEDNCPVDPNADQADKDADDLGDVCDSCCGDNQSGNVDGDEFCADLDCNDNDAGASEIDVCGVCGGDGSICVLFFDSFESGSTGQWSSSSP